MSRTTIRVPRLAIPVFLAGVLLVASCSKAPAGDTAQANGSPDLENTSSPAAPDDTAATGDAEPPNTTAATGSTLAPAAPDDPAVTGNAEALDDATATSTTSTPEETAATSPTEGPDDTASTDFALATAPKVETADETTAGKEDTADPPEPEPVSEEAPDHVDTADGLQREDNQSDPTWTQEMSVPDAAAVPEARVAAATVTPSRFVITGKGQSFTAEVLVELSDQTDEPPSVTVERPVTFPDVVLSMSDAGCTQDNTAWRCTLTVSHPGRIVYPPGYVWEGAVAVETSDGQGLSVPFTVEVGNTGSVDHKARVFLAGRLGVTADQIEVTAVEPVTFNNGSKGCDQAGYAYIAAEVPGFIITMTHGEAVHVVHTDEHGGHFVVPENCQGGRWRPR